MEERTYSDETLKEKLYTSLEEILRRKLTRDDMGMYEIPRIVIAANLEVALDNALVGKFTTAESYLAEARKNYKEVFKELEKSKVMDFNYGKYIIETYKTFESRISKLQKLNDEYGESE